MKSGKAVLFGIFVLLSGVGVWLYTSGQGQGAGGHYGSRVVSVVTAPVKLQEFSDIVEALGTVKASESVTITSSVADTITEIFFEDGNQVQKGDLLVELKSWEEKAQLKEAQANLEEAQKQYERIQNLVESGNVSTATVDAEQRKLDEAMFRFQAEKARFRDRRIFAPFDGVLGMRQVSEGTYLSTNTPITTLDAIDTIKLDFYVPERFVSTLQPGQTVSATVEAYPDRTFDGKVRAIDSRIDPVTRSVLIRADIPNEEHLLKPGMLMVVKVVSRSWDGLSIPEEAIVPAGSKMNVFTVTDGVAKRQAVELGIRRPGYVEVTSGLQDSDRVVVQGTFRLHQTGQKVSEMKNDEQAAGGEQ